MPILERALQNFDPQFEAKSTFNPESQATVFLRRLRLGAKSELQQVTNDRTKNYFFASGLGVPFFLSCFGFIPFLSFF